MLQNDMWEKMCMKCFLVIGILQFRLEQSNTCFYDQFLFIEGIQSVAGLSKTAYSTGSGPCWIPAEQGLSRKSVHVFTGNRNNVMFASSHSSQFLIVCVSSVLGAWRDSLSGLRLASRAMECCLIRKLQQDGRYIRLQLPTGVDTLQFHIVFFLEYLLRFWCNVMVHASL
jgi:hypothetical protein